MSTPPLMLRPYADSDHAKCMAVFASNVPFYFAAAEAPEFADYLRSESAHYLVAEWQGSLVGGGGWMVAQGGQGRLCWGMVHSDHQRRAIGSALLRARLALLFREAPVRSVGIDTSQHTAPFFHRFGFRELSREPDGFAPGLDRVCMALAHASAGATEAAHLNAPSASV